MAGYAGRDAVIVGAVRTPIGKGKANGALHDVLPADLLAHSLRELVARTGIDPAADRRRHRGRRHPGRRPGRQHRPQRAARRRVPRDRARHHRRPPVRKQPAGDQLRRPGRDLRRLRHRDRRGRRVDVPRADGLQVLPGSDPFGAFARALPRRPCAAGHQRRADRREVGLLAHRSSTSSPRAATKRPPRATKEGCSTTSCARSPGWPPTRSSGPAPRSRRWPV